MPACTFHPFANERSRRTICSPSLCFFSADICCSFHWMLALDSWQREWPGKIQPVFKKREKEKGVGKREGCATWFRVLYPCVSCEDRGVDGHGGEPENECQPRAPLLRSRQIPFIYFPSLSFYRALPCYTRVPSNGSLFRTIEEFHSIENPGSRWIIRGSWLWRFPFSGDNFFFRGWCVVESSQ